MSEVVYYAVLNDLIGGYDVSTHNKNVGDHDHDNGEYTEAWGMTKEFAERVARALNKEEYARFMRGRQG